MSVQHKATSIKNKPKSVEELTRENEQLREKNESLSGQVTDLQLALCDVYEMIEATVYQKKARFANRRKSRTVRTIRRAWACRSLQGTRRGRGQDRPQEKEKAIFSCEILHFAARCVGRPVFLRV